MATNTLSENITLAIKKADGSSFYNLSLKKFTVDSQVMSLGDKITGDVYYVDNSLLFTMQEYVEYNGVKYTIVNPPTIVKEGLARDNSENKGTTKYSLEFYHPMYQLGNLPFNDVAVNVGESRYMSESVTFNWVGYPDDYIAKLNKNLQGTQWIVVKSSNFPSSVNSQISEVLSFDKESIAGALKKMYETWELPYVIDKVASSESSYAQGKYFKVIVGMPSEEIYDEGSQDPFVFKCGQGVGLKNNSRSPRNNKIITRIAGYGSERNIPYGYPQIVWTGSTSDSRLQYPLYDGIVGGQPVKLIKHPFTRKTLMPSIYVETVNRKVNPNASGYNPNTEIIEYYDATAAENYPNPINPLAPSYETHEFEDIYPRLDSASIVGAIPCDKDYKVSVPFSDIPSVFNHYISISSNYYEKACLAACRSSIVSGCEEINIDKNVGSYSFVFTVTHDDTFLYIDYKSDGLLSFNFIGVRSGVIPPAPVWDDTMDDKGEYKQSYLEITLPILSFDIYACASITEQMQINMRSGACIGCTFDVAVDWDDYKKNFFNADGDFVPDGAQRDLVKYPKSNVQSITVTAKKDLDTFGTLMPNRYQQPQAGDKFVILGISLPLSYIQSAEAELADAAKAYMRENNIYYFDYPLKFDEFFLRNNDHILSQINPNAIVRFDYAGDEKTLYIKQLTTKVGYAPLPQFDITLTDNIEVSLNQIGQTVDELGKLSDVVALLRRQTDSGLLSPILSKLSKTDDDTANGMIRFMKGLQIGRNFTSGILGSGGIIGVDEDGLTYLEVDEIYARMKAVFDNIEVRNYQHSIGNRVVTKAGIKCSRVEWVNGDGEYLEQDSSNLSSVSVFRCFYRAKDSEDEVKNDFIAGVNIEDGKGTQDLAFCDSTDILTGLNKRSYWRAVVGKNSDGTYTLDGEGWIDLSKTDCRTGSDIPMAGDDIIQLGNVSNKDRQGAIVEYIGGEGAPCYKIYQEIGLDERTDEEKEQDPPVPFDPYVLDEKCFVDFGYSHTTKRAYMNVYGDMYVGEKGDAPSTYIRYTQPHKEWVTPEPTEEVPEPEPELVTMPAKLEIKAIIDAQSTMGGRTFQNIFKNIQDQLDGVIDNYFLEGVPSLSMPPVVSTEEHPYSDPWLTGNETPEERAVIFNNHLGDLYYDKLTDLVYRFESSYDPETEITTYSWQHISDDAIAEALRIANQAKATADGKRRVFTTTPYSPYDAGDLWVNVAGTFTKRDGTSVTYNNDILKCIAPIPRSGAQEGDPDITTFNIGDWSLASGYTDDTKFNNYITQVLNGVQNPQGDSAVVAQAMHALKGALNENTTIEGGLILTSLISLKNQGTVWSGISGQYQSEALGKGIAAWYGGAMADMGTMTDAQKTAWDALTDEQKIASNTWAKSLFRFDGSGYLAANNIYWNAAGSMVIRNLQTIYGTTGDSISINTLSSLSSIFATETYGSGATTELLVNPQNAFSHLFINRTGNVVTYPQDLKTINDYSVLNFGEMKARFVTVDFFNALFQAKDSNGTTINVNTANPSVSSIKALVGLWTEQYLSALGQNSLGGGGGVSSLYQLDEVNINASTLAAGQVLKTRVGANGIEWYNGTDEGTNTTYKLTLNGTTNGDSVNGVNLGSLYAPTVAGTGFLKASYSNNKIAWTWDNSTYLTSHQSVTDHDVTLSWNTRSKIATIGATEIHVTMPANPDTNTWRNIYLSCTQKLGTGIDTKALNFLGDGKTTITFLPAGTEEGQSGSEDYATLKISSTWRGVQDNLTSDSSVDSLSAKQGKVLKSSIDTLSGYFENDVAKSAAKLTTVSQTLFGNTYWTSNGVPTSIGTATTSAPLNYVSDITMSGKLKIGDIYIEYDQANNAIEIYKLNGSTKVAANLYAYGGVSALGYSSSGSGGGVTTLEGLSDVDISSPSNGQVLTYSNGMWVNAQAPSSSGVTSVGMTVPTGFAVSPATITSSGTFAITFTSGYSLPTTAQQTNWNTAYTNSHTHSNKSLLDDISQTEITNWNAAYSDKHSHSNKSVLDDITSSDLTNWGTAYDNTHTHSNKSVLDGITSTKVSNWDDAYSWGNHANAGYMTIEAFERLFNAIASDGTTKVNHPYSSGVASIKAMVGLWTEQYLSALGQNSSGGGSVVDMDIVWQALAGNTTEQINISHLTTALSGYAQTSQLSSYLARSGGSMTNTNLVTNLNADLLDGVHIGGLFTDFSNIASGDDNNKTSITIGGTTKKLIVNYAASSGSAASAARLGTVSKTAWGQTFWTDGGVPQSISGNLSNVADVFSDLGQLNGFNKLELSAASNAGNGGAIYFHYNGMYGRSSGYIINDADGSISVLTPTGTTGLKVGTTNGDYIQIGDIRLVYESSSNSLKVISSDNSTAANFYATGAVSALGLNASGGGGATALGGLTDVQLTNETTGQLLRYNGTKWINFTPSYATTSQLNDYLPLAGGGVITGNSIQMTVSSSGLSWKIGSTTYGSIQFSMNGSPVINLSSITKYNGYDIRNSNDTYIDSTNSRVYIGGSYINVGGTNVSFGTEGADYIPITIGSTTKNVLTSHQSLSGYLPLSGGTLTGALTLSYGDSATDQFITFVASDNVQYKLGIRRPFSDYGLSFYDSSDYYKVWHEGNLVYVSQLTNDAGYATQSWVQQQSYLTTLSLGGLSNVSLSAVSNGQVLTYQSSNGTWVNGSISFPVTSVGGYTGAVTAADIASALNNQSIGSLTIGTALGIGTAPASGYTLDVDGSVRATSIYVGSNAVIDAGNIGNQSVNFASSANILGCGVQLTSDHALSDGDVLVYDSGSWFNIAKSVYLDGVITTSNIGSQSVSYAATAGAATDSSKLPLTGGTLSGGLTFSCGDSSTDQFITFVASDNVRYKLGIRRPFNTFGLTFYDGSNYYKVITEANISSQNVAYAASAGSATDSTKLPLEGGGTIYDSSSDYQLVVNEQSISFKYNGNTYGTVRLDYGIDGEEFDISSNATLGGFAIATQDWVGQQNYLTSIPLASSSTRGGVKTGFLTDASNRNYAVQLSSEKMYVNVPWTDTTYTNGTGISVTANTLSVYGDYVIAINSTYQTYISHGESAYNSLSSYLPLTGGTLSGRINVPSVNISGGSIVSTAVGSGTYNRLSWDLGSDFEFEFPNTTDSYNGTHIPIYFGWRGGVYPFTIASNENVGIGTTSPSYKLHVNGNTFIQGILGVGTAPASGYSVDVDGTVRAAAFNNNSDIRKKDVYSYGIEPTCEAVANAPAIRFMWKEKMDKGYFVGSVAQYWESIVPEAVNKDAQGYLSMQYDVIALLASIATAKRVVEHERRIETLELENALLRMEINELKAA